MSERLIRDKYGIVIGKIVTRNDEITELHDKYGILIGSYNSHYDRTYDKYGVTIGQGNILTTLL